MQSLLPKSLLNVVRSAVPSGLRSKLKSLASKPVELPPISDADRHYVFERIADDLTGLHERLGDAVAAWPSVQKLGER